MPNGSSKTRKKKRPPPTTHVEWLRTFRGRARGRRNDKICRSCRKRAAKKDFPVVDVTGEVVGRERRCAKCQASYEKDHKFRTRENLRYRDRMRFLCWEGLGGARNSLDDITELTTRLIWAFGGIEGVVSYAHVLIHRKDTPTSWRRRIVMALVGLMHAHEAMDRAKEERDLRGEKVAKWMTNVAEDEALEFLTPVLAELIDNRMDVIVEYLRMTGWTMIPPWSETPVVNGADTPYHPDANGNPSIPDSVSVPLSFPGSTQRDSQSSSGG